MKNYISIPLLGLALTAWSPLAMAREVVVLPGVVGTVGVASGVDTQGPGTLTVGSQNINTGNDAGGAITSSAANTASILFNGNSMVTGFVGSTGTTFLNIAAGANGNTVTFNGPVYATTFSLSGTGTVNFNQGFTSNTGSTMDFAGDGFINVGAGKTVKAALTNTAGADTGTLTLNQNSIFDGAVGAASGLKQINVVGGNALITGEAKASAFTLGTNTLNVAGALAIPVGGTINTTIFSTSLYGKITPVGAATIGDNLHVKVDVTGPIVNGSSFNIVDAASGTTGSTVLVSTNTTRYAFSAAPTVAGQVKITTTQIPLADVVAPVVAPIVNPPPGGGQPPPVVIVPVVNPVVPLVIAPVVDALPVTPITAPVLTAITLLPTAPAVAAALAQLGPGTTNLAAPQIGYSVTQRFQDLWASHLETEAACTPDSQANDRRRARLDETSACRPSDLRAHLWASGFGNFARQGDVNGFEGYRSRIVGGMLAYEAPLGETVRAGVGIRYASSTLDGNTGASHADIASYQATAYLGYAPGPGYINAAVVYGLDRYTGSRQVVFPGVDSTIAAKYNGHQFTAFVTTGYHFYAGGGRTIITPHATLQYTSLHADAYTETGDDAIDLRVDAQHYNFVQSGLGARISQDLPLAGSGSFRPEAHANWLHAFGGATMSQTAAFATGGPQFTTLGLTPERNTFNVGGGATFGQIGRWSLEGVYDYLWRAQNFSAHQVRLNLVLHL